jgi:hypothetical protein
MSDALPETSFPVKPTKQHAQAITAALLVDSLSALGVGAPSARADTSRLRQWFFDYSGELWSELEELYGSQAVFELERHFFSLPAIGSASTLAVLELLAIRARVQAVLEISGIAGSQSAAEQLWAIHRQAVFAHGTLASYDAGAGLLRSVLAMRESICGSGKPRIRVDWSSGLTLSDVNCAVIGGLLDSESITADYRCWFQLLKSPVFAAGRPLVEFDAAAARSAIREMTLHRVGVRSPAISRVLSELDALREMERELIDDSRIDPFVTDLWVGEKERFSLGRRGHIELAAAFRVRPNSRVMTEEEWSEFHAALENPALVHEPAHEAQLAGQGQRNRADQDQIYFEPIGSTRVFIAWRGAPASGAEARRHIPAVLRSAVRTAWMATLGRDSALRYLVDSRYQEFDAEGRGAAMHGFNPIAQSGMAIALHPEEFPIRLWIDHVLAQAVSDESTPAAGRSCAINAVRLLHTADELLHTSPAQSFLCSMSAIEAGLGGRGADLCERVARRAARLLVGELAERQLAIEAFRALYNTRSRIAHGDQCQVSARQAVFMRYVASCVAYSLAGVVRAAPRFGIAASEDGVRKFLDSDQFTAGLPVGAVEHHFLIEVLKSPERLAYWVEE